MMAARKLVGKTLGDLLPAVAPEHVAHTITGLAIDSRWVRAGDLFCAYPGVASDGRDYIVQAVAAGAAAVAVEPGRALPAVDVPVVIVPGLRECVSAIADRYFDQPSAAMRVVGVTGTNGKTSVTQLLGQALRALGRRCGVIGTLGNSLDGSVGNGGLTTPDPVALQQQLADWRDQQVRYVAMEVSSHGLAQGRVGGVHFRGAAFTNLTRDHLDFHGTMASYGAAKARLFGFDGLQFGVINADDDFGRELAAQLQGALPVFEYSLAEPASISVRGVGYALDGIRAEVITPWGRIALRAPLLGDFNLGNLLAVIGVLGGLGFGVAEIEAVLPKLRPIAGRMERIGAGADIEVVIDYAHTPDALEHVLSALRAHCSGRLWCVFGCGGDRDRGKRPQMGAIAVAHADCVIVTSDNPRGEQADAIIAEILQGMPSTRDHVRVEADRARAIAAAIGEAAAGDMVLIAGKGHEDYQVIGSERLPFSDSTVARAALQARRSS